MTSTELWTKIPRPKHRAKKDQTHGVHSGIHFRSSNYWGILLGEAVALSFLNDRAKSYNEPFTINITKFDGTIATITNQNADGDLFFADGPCPQIS